MKKRVKIGKIIIAVALIALLSAYCFSAHTAAIPVPIQPKLSGEPPTFGLEERWTYSLNFTNMTSLSSAQTSMYANTTGFLTTTNDYYGNMSDCYVLWFSPVDPQSILILLDVLSRGFGITDLNASDIVGLGNSSVLRLFLSVNPYLEEYNFSWVKSIWNVSYDTDDKKLYASLVLTPNVICSYSIFNFTLNSGKTFGNYTETLNIKFGSLGPVCYYNGSWYNNSAVDNLTYNFPDTYLFYPAFRVEGTEMVTVPAGTFECWRIAVLNATDPSDTVGYYWYSPSAKNYAKINVTTTDLSGNEYNTYAELTYYKSTVSPWSPGMAWGLLMFLLFPYLAVYNSYQQQQRNTMLFMGAAVLLIVAIVVGIIISARRRQK
ncbi:MAG: hypothetical protein QXG44_15095 [Candidatus Jordarchaeaceae archaeon]